jgi:hypothetical protein
MQAARNTLSQYGRRRGMAYTIAIQRLDGTRQADRRIYDGAAPKYGAIVEHKCGGKTVKVRIAAIRMIPAGGRGKLLDQVDAMEVA